MGRPTLANTKDTKTDLTRVALEMIQTRGYNAFSYQDLSERLKISKASIHYHFATKEDLGVSLMEAGLERITAWQLRIQGQELSPVTRLEAYFDYFAALSDNGKRICPCGALASEWQSLPQKLQASVTRLMTAHREWLKSTLSEGRRLGEFSKKGTPEEQAQFVFASIQGALQTSRAQDNPSYFRAVTRQLLNALTL